MAFNGLVSAGTKSLDLCSIAVPLEITHGRSGVTAQPDAPVLDLDWIDPAPPCVIGDTITVVSTTPGVTPGGDYDSTRFVGTVVTMTAEASDGVVQQWSVRAVGTLADLGVNDVYLTRPVETDVARVHAICAAAGVAVTVEGTATMELAADNVERDALSALHQVCESSGGLLWQAPDGGLRYGTWDHRAASVDAVVLDCQSILDGVVWDETIESVINHLTVSYGPEASQVEQTYSDASSIGAWGKRHQDVGSILATLPDADALALTILTRRKDPHWAVPQVLLPMDDLTADQWELTRGLRVGSQVLLPISAGPGATPSSELVARHVEGWVERWDESGHWMQLATSDRARWGGPPLRTWQEVYSDGEHSWGEWLSAVDSWVDLLAKV